MSTAPANELPSKPFATFGATRPWYDLDLRGVWRRREMLLMLTKRDVKVRYKQTLLGVAWAILQPLGPMLVYTLVFSVFLKLPGSGAVPYAVFVYTGLLPWTYFANAISQSSNSLGLNSGLLSKIYFPRLILPAAATLAGLVDFAVNCTLLLGLMAIYRLPFSWSLLLLPPLMLYTALLAFAVGVNLAALNTVYRDVRQALPFLIQLWMFLTPVIYAREIVPEQWQWLLGLNPMTGVIEAFRAVLIGQPLPWSHLAVSVIITTCLLLSGAYLFSRMEKHLADYL